VAVEEVTAGRPTREVAGDPVDTGRRSAGAGHALGSDRRPRDRNGPPDVGRPIRTEAFYEVREARPQVPGVGGLQPDLPAAVGPPDLEVGDGAFLRPVLTPLRQHDEVDEASDAHADVDEDPDRTGPGNAHDHALEDLPEAQASPYPDPLLVCHHA